MRLRARHYRTGAPIDVVCAGGRIASVETPSHAPADLEAGFIAPALFDLQINGGHDIAFGSATLTVEQVHEVAALCHRHGITGLCPTLITGGEAEYLHALAVLRRACESDAALGRAMPCFHMEGPCISREDGPRGAHPLAHVRVPDRDEFERLQDAAGGRIRLVTLAPELPGALAFIEWLSRQGIVVAMGHTAATPATIRDAVRAGARLSTHLGNGCHATLPRHESYFWEQLACDELYASIISDGHHLPPAILRCIVRSKPADKLIVTCDASSLADMAPGRYRVWGQELEVQAGGKVVVPGTAFLAGSGVFTDACVAHLVRHDILPLADAIDAACRARELLGLPAVSLAAGSPADLVLFDSTPDEPFRVRATVAAGRPA